MSVEPVRLSLNLKVCCAIRVPGLVMTAAESARQRALDVGAEGWLGKPFELDELSAVVRRYVPSPPPTEC